MALECNTNDSSTTSFSATDKSGSEVRFKFPAVLGKGAGEEANKIVITVKNDRDDYVRQNDGALTPVKFRLASITLEQASALYAWLGSVLNG